MFNVNQITSQLAKMPDPMLQKYAAMHKNDPYTVSLALAESNRRKAMRVGAAPMPGEQPKVVDQDIAEMFVPQQQLPENIGIGQLPAQNMQRMADGGIVGYADGGEIQSFRKGGTPEEEAFNQAFLRTLRYEGGRTNDTGGDTKYGISKKANPDVDIDKLTVEGARRLYKERYWDAINGDKLAAINPKLAQVAFDTAVNQSPAKAKELVTASGGDPAKMMQLRGEHYDSLVQKNPEKYGSFAKGWAARLGNLATDLAIPSAQAAETTKPTPAAPVAPTNTNEVPQAVDFSKPQTAAPVAPRSQWQAMADAARGIVGAGETALQYGTGMLAIPTAGVASLLGSKTTPEAEEKFRKYAGEVTYQPRTEAGQNISESTRRVLEDLKIPPILAHAGHLPARRGGAGVSSAELSELANRMTKEAETPRLAGPTTSETMVQGRGQPPVKQGAAVAQQMADIENAKAFHQAAASAKANERIPSTTPDILTRNAELARAQAVAAGTSPAATAGIASLGQTGAGKDQGLPMGDLGFDRSGLDALDKADKKELIDIGKSATPDGKGKDFSNDMLLMLGLNMMAGQSPNFLTNVGQAGISALKYGQEAKKEESERLYREALAKHYGVDPMIQRAQALQDPAIAKQFAKMKELEREPVTREKLLDVFMKSPEGMAASNDPVKFRTAFQNYVQSIESVLGPMGGMPPGTRVTRVGP